MQRNEEGPVAVTNATFAKTVLEAPQPVLVSSGEIRRVLVGARSGQEYRAAIEGELH